MSLRRHAAALLPLAACICALGCGHGSSRQSTFAETSATVPLGEVELLNAGEAPRRALRHAWPTGTTTRFKLRVRLGVGTLDGETLGSYALPAIVLELTAGPVADDPLDDDLRRFDLVIDRVDAAPIEEDLPDDADALRAAFATLNGVHLEVAMDPEGRTRPSSVSVPAGVSPTVLQFFNNIRAALLLVHFPEAPVGIGAQWRIRREVQPLPDEPWPISETVVYTLSELEGNRGRLEVAFHESAQPRDLGRLGDANELARIDLYETLGVGAVEFDLERLIPRASLDAVQWGRTTYRSADRTRRVDERFRVIVVADVPR